MRRRLVVEGLEAVLLPRPSTPRSSPRSVGDAVVQLACRTREELVQAGWDAGPLSVQARLRDQGVEPPSRATLARIFSRAGLVVAQPRKRPRSSFHRFVYPLPNACWQMDALEVPLATGRATVFQLLDDHARLMIASRAAVSENSHDAIQTVSTGIAAHGVPQRLLTDNGSALNQDRRGGTAALTRYVTSLGIQAITGRPYKPTTQGKNERVHQTLQRFLAAHDRPRDLPELQALLDRFDTHYNQHRPHQALHGQTPAQAYTALPKATPPTPPAGQQHTPNPMRAEQRTVDARGSVYVATRQFQVGATHRNNHVTVLHDGHTFHLIDQAGTIIDTHIDPPRNTYIPRHRHHTQETETSPTS